MHIMLRNRSTLSPTSAARPTCLPFRSSTPTAVLDTDSSRTGSGLILDGVRTPAGLIRDGVRTWLGRGFSPLQTAQELPQLMNTARFTTRIQYRQTHNIR
jgi:hypothetical protein